MLMNLVNVCERINVSNPSARGAINFAGQAVPPWAIAIASA